MRSLHARLVVAALVAVGAASLGSCSWNRARSAEAGAPPGQGQSADFLHAEQQARALWQARKLVRYEYRMAGSCLCPFAPSSPVRITVDPPYRSRIEPVGDHSGFDFHEDVFYDFDTIDKVFDSIERAMGRRPDSIAGQFDAADGYPTHLVFGDPTGDKSNEGTLELWITEFKPLPKAGA